MQGSLITKLRSETAAAALLRRACSALADTTSRLIGLSTSDDFAPRRQRMAGAMCVGLRLRRPPPWGCVQFADLSDIDITRKIFIPEVLFKLAGMQTICPPTMVVWKVWAEHHQAGVHAGAMLPRVRPAQQCCR
jgi:hypothetical protein